MNEALKTRNHKLGERVVSALKNRYYDAYYCETKDEALALALSLIPKDHEVSWGGATSAIEIGLLSKIKSEGYRYNDRDEALSPEQRAERTRRSLTCDTFIMGANAVSEDGVIVNIDGIGNRTAAMIYGPKSVIMLCGINKVVKTAQDAVQRARTVAAPINAQRFNIETPCKKTGCCADCTRNDSVCSQIVVSRFCKVAGRIKVIVVGEQLGF